MTKRSQAPARPWPLTALALALLPALLSGTARAEAGADPEPAFGTDDEKLLYYWGTTFGQQLGAVRIDDPKELAWILKGVTDSAAGKGPEFGDDYPSLLNNYLVRRNQQAARAEAAEARAYVARMAKEKGAILTDDGLVYEERRQGTGPRPTRTSRVRVHYTGTLRDGRAFDSSRDRGAPLETPLDRVIPCWTEGLQLMQAGGEARITCPPELAYGERTTGRIPGGSALTFEVELLDVLD